MSLTLRASILLVDDDPSVRRSLGRLLRAHDYEVLEAGNVAQALDILATTRPSLMLVDMIMPGESSLPAVRKIKGELHTAQIPVIALTGSPPTAPEDRALFAAVVAKPAAAQALLEAIERALRSSEPGSGSA